jgi:hypothetical protein
MALPSAPVDQFARILLRRGVGELAASRDECIDCGRTPLTGERVHLYDGRRGGIVCELCRTLRREPPVASEIVRHCEHGHAVRLTVRVGTPRDRLRGRAAEDLEVAGFDARSPVG